MNHLLGRGAYGAVFKGKSQQGLIVAVKMIDRRMINKENERHLKNEVESMRSLNHPNIVKFLDYYESQNNIYIISEFCDGGDLRDLIKKGKQTEEEVLDILKQILYGYKELLNKQIIHRDLKPANILIHKQIIKIADFGFSKRIDYENDLMNSIAGTPLYMAPQTVFRQQYSSKCDIWSLGMIIYELLFQQPPIKAQNILDLQEQIKLPIFIPILKNEQLYELLQKCLKVNEEERISWEEIYQLKLFNNEIDYYMQQIENVQEENKQNQYQYQFKQPLANNNSINITDYQKLMIQNYLQIEFNNNSKKFVSIINNSKSIFNFSIFINLNNIGTLQIVQQLQILAYQYLEKLNDQNSFKEYISYIQTDQGQNYFQQYQQYKQNLMDQIQNIQINEQLNYQELIKIFELQLEQITKQSAYMTHQKLLFIFITKDIIKFLKQLDQNNNNKNIISNYQLNDITLLQCLTDQELAFRIGQL